jgi:hypothetical protein
MTIQEGFAAGAGGALISNRDLESDVKRSVIS